MRGPTIYFLIFILFIQGGISWLSYHLLENLFAVYRQPLISRVYWLLTITAIVSFVLLRTAQPLTVSPDILRWALVWLIGQFALLLLLPLFYIGGRLLRPIRDKAAKHDQGQLSRREFLQTTAAVLPAASLGISSYGVYSGGAEIVTTRHNLGFSDLPSGLNHFKIVQISDAHLGLFFSLETLDQVLAVVRQEQPDMLVITGDLIDDLSLLKPAVEKISALAPMLPYGSYFCWGNHEYFRDITKVRQALTSSPVRLLENSSKLIVDGERPFYLVGVDYPWANNGQEQAEKRRLMFNQAMHHVPPDAFTILLSHHPDFIHNAFADGIPLTLSGHTHGGQVAVFGRPLLPVRYQYMLGMYQQQNSYAYVSAGAGSWFPFRLGCPAEITVFTLQRVTAG